MAFLIPTFTQERITGLDASTLHAAGVQGLLLDVDNTLCVHHGQQPLPGVAVWLEQMKKAGFRICIVSNASEERVKPLAQRLEIPFFSNCKKPLPGRLRRAVREMGLRCSEVLLVGDQIFTDVLGGNLAGCRTVLVTPAEPEQGRAFRFKRFVERPFFKRAQRRTKERKLEHEC